MSSGTSARASNHWWKGRAGIGDRVFSNMTLVFAFLMVALLVGMVVMFTLDALPSITKFGVSFLGGTVWNPVTNVFGALPAVYGTILSSLIGLIIAIPVSLGAAIFLAELAPSWIRGPASFLVEMLAAIPSVIIGLWGIYVMVPFVRDFIEKGPVGNSLSSLPLFQGPPLGQGFLAAGLILAIMVIPIITAVSRDVMRSVPQSQREAMLALGATQWETIRQAVIPYCRSGLVGAAILGLGRAMGETMAVLMVIGSGYKMTASLFAPGSSIASKIASEFVEAQSKLMLSSLIELALVLFGLTLLVNIIARLMVWRLTTVRAGWSG